MIEWRPLELGHKALCDGYLAQQSPGISDLTFTNLFLWHFSERIELAEHGGMLCLRVRKGDAVEHFLPLGVGPQRRCLDQLIDEARNDKRPFTLRSLTAAQAAQLETAMPAAFAVTPVRERFDYVYAVHDLINLAGEKYHAKKNHLNKFTRSYDWKYLPLDPSLIDRVAHAEIDWCEQRQCDSDEGLKGEKAGIVETLKQFGHLDYQGAVIVIGDRIAAFTFGEALSRDTVVIHIEKADPKFPGAYAAINQQFLEHEWPAMAWVNREEDLGIEGLRQAKLSYHPARFVEKYWATLKP
ncbi:MAG TPA: phosphatidylglycerol lysyltransferase domain-containing protein [Candidatus Edwardsbacteria bacterium]|nr:phosphatidylglycerol lysyltransferase domain-containing protein [Candidatus Edwardsbacteria bacterium]